MARPHFLILDGSYFLFFRYHAMRRWWQHARREGEPEDPLESERYRASFVKNFSKKLAGLAKLVGHDADRGPLIGILAEDCAPGTCWRRTIWEPYKATRKDDARAHAHFHLVRELNLFAHEALNARLSYPGLEGDDCIAITTAEIQRKHPDAQVDIVSSDGDFKQLPGSERAIDRPEGDGVGRR